MNQFTRPILGLVICMLLINCQTGQSQVADQQVINAATTKKIDALESYRGIKILDEGPTGSKHTNSYRGEFGCSKFRITIFNDTIVPIELVFQFPSKQVTSSPDTNFKVQGWVLPDELTPDTFQNAFNFGITGLEDHFNSDFTDPGMVKTTIQPKGHHSFYLAFIGESTFEFGSNYSQLFIHGQDVDVPYLPEESIKIERTSENVLDLVWGIGHTPHNLYTWIHCGQITYLE